MNGQPWRGVSLLATLLVLAVSLGASGAGDYGTRDDVCERIEDLVLCGGSGAASKPGSILLDPRSLEPDASRIAHQDVIVAPKVARAGSNRGIELETITPQDHQDPHPGGSQYLGNNTCRYWGTRYADGDFGGNANYGVDNSMGMYVRATANQPFLPGRNTSSAFARGGVVISLGENWPQPSSVTVTFPWHTQGQLDVNSDADASAEAEHETLMLLFRGSELAAQDVVVSRSINTSLGPRTENVSRDGVSSLTVASPGNISYYGLGVNWGWASATGATVTFTNARGTSLFFGPGLHVWLDHQDWRFNLPSGWEIAACD